MSKPCVMRGPLLLERPTVSEKRRQSNRFDGVSEMASAAFLRPFRVMDCYQCAKCSAGCPIADHSDLLPHDVVRLAQLGDFSKLFDSSHLWLCLACGACLARCPNRVDLPGLIDALRARSHDERRPAAENRVPAFHQAFLAALRARGRVNELALIARYKSLTGTWFEDIPFGIKLFLKGKLPLFGGPKAGRDILHSFFEVQ